MQNSYDRSSVLILLIFIIYILYLKRNYNSRLREYNLISLKCNPIDLFINSLFDINNNDYETCIKNKASEYIEDKFGDIDNKLKDFYDQTASDLTDASDLAAAQMNVANDKINQTINQSDEDQDKLEDDLTTTKNTIDTFKQYITGLKSDIQNIASKIASSSITNELQINPTTAG